MSSFFLTFAIFFLALAREFSKRWEKVIKVEINDRQDIALSSIENSDHFAPFYRFFQFDI